MQRQQGLRLGDVNALRASWARFTDEQRKQVRTIFRSAEIRLELVTI